MIVAVICLIAWNLILTFALYGVSVRAARLGAHMKALREFARKSAMDALVKP